MLVRNELSIAALAHQRPQRSNGPTGDRLYDPFHTTIPSCPTLVFSGSSDGSTESRGGYSGISTGHDSHLFGAVHLREGENISEDGATDPTYVTYNAVERML